MGKLLYTIELIFILIASCICSVNTFAEGYTLTKTDMVAGIMIIILSILAVVLGVLYYQFYKLLE